MTMTGKITKKHDGIIEIALKGSNSRGDHVVGTVVLELPDPPTSAGATSGRTSRRRRSKRKKDKKKGKK